MFINLSFAWYIFIVSVRKWQYQRTVYPHLDSPLRYIYVTPFAVKEQATATNYHMNMQLGEVDKILKCNRKWQLYDLGEGRHNKCSQQLSKNVLPLRYGVIDETAHNTIYKKDCPGIRINNISFMEYIHGSIRNIGRTFTS